MNWPSATMVARSITFRSSRTLPGQSCASSTRIASGLAAATALPSRALNSTRNAWTSSGRSAFRSLSGGSAIGKTLSR